MARRVRGRADVAVAGAGAEPDAAPVPQSTPDANSPNGAAVAPANPQQEGGLGEIIVTAQRVSESSQRAPIAIDVISPEDLVRQNVVRAEDLSRTSTALSATGSTGGPTTVFFVRGVGNAPSTPIRTRRSRSTTTASISAGRARPRACSTICSGSKCSKVRRVPCTAGTHRRRDQRDPQPAEAGRHLGRLLGSATAITTG